MRSLLKRQSRIDSGGRNPRVATFLFRAGSLSALFLFSGCDADGPPPPHLTFGGLPVSGSLADAQRRGFTACFNPDAIRMRCRRHAVMLAGQGPYEAAIDLSGGRGRGGFDQLTLWHDRDQYAVYKIRDALKNQGWRYCYTGTDQRGDQVIFSRKGVPVRISMDLSYWGKRRLRLIPEWNQREERCTPDRDLV